MNTRYRLAIYGRGTTCKRLMVDGSRNVLHMLLLSRSLDFFKDVNIRRDGTSRIGAVLERYVYYVCNENLPKLARAYSFPLLIYLYVFT